MKRGEEKKKMMTKRKKKKTKKLHKYLHTAQPCLGRKNSLK
jgi:hypothetical protein